MAEQDLSSLELAIREIPGVLGCVVLSNPDGTPAEVQAFTEAGVDRQVIEAVILEEAAGRGMGAGIGQTFVFELEAESHLGGGESLDRAAELAEQEARSKGPLGVLHALGTLHSLAESAPATELPTTAARPPLRRVVLSSSSWRSEAEVTLGDDDLEITGTASGDKSPHGLQVVAEATLQAAAQLVPGREFAVKGATIVTVFGHEAVLVIVQEDAVTDMLGAALVRGAPTTEAAVRATLDAINRRLATGR
ncbi:hypothetical protein BH24ACT26_BH24ACT26_02260 [soil metagenome]